MMQEGGYYSLLIHCMQLQTMKETGPEEGIWDWSGKI